MDQQNNVIENESSKNKTVVYELMVKDSKNNVESRYSLEAGKEVLVGADPTECEVYLDDEYASKKHFSVMLTGEKIEVNDLGSKNGLFLLLDNGSVEITPGQTLLAGNTILKLEVKKDEPDSLLPESEGDTE